jgi:hypothetical protein
MEADKKKKQINPNPKPKSEVATPPKASRKRLALEVASPVTAKTTPASATAATNTSPTPATGMGEATSPTAPPAASASSAPATPAAPSSADTTVVDVTKGPPDVTVPTVPPGAHLVNLRTLGSPPLTTRELDALAQVVTDLTNFVDYASLLGTAAPDASAIVAEVTVGLKWRAMRDASDAWDAYVRSSDGQAWVPALESLEQLRAFFLGAVAQKPSLAHTYPGLWAYYNARKPSAKAALATKKKKAKAKSVAQASAAQAATATASGGSTPSSK